MSRPHGLLYLTNLFGKKDNKVSEGLNYFKWNWKHAAKLAKFKNIHAGEDCFIIGNGPSLGKMDLSTLADYHTFGLNKIYLIFEKFDLNLSYLVSTNDLVIQQSKEVYENFDCPIFLSYSANNGIVRPLDHINYLYTLNTWSFYDDLTKPICVGYTVTYCALQVAYYMGFRRVFLIGVDHSFKQQGNPHEIQTLDGPDENHFHPDYFAGQKWELADVEGSEVSYHMANYFYRRDKRAIYDATVGGKLDVFPKVDFQEALKKMKKKR